MMPADLRRLIQGVASGDVAVDDALRVVQTWPYLEVGDVKFDLHRKARRGLPEVVYCKEKRPEQVREIFARVSSEGVSVLGTRAREEHVRAVRERLPDVGYEPIGGILRWDAARETAEEADSEHFVALVSAGATDESVLYEAKGTLEAFGHRVETITDAGVAGLQRILAHVDTLNRAAVVIVVAGMDGALPSVTAGLTESPVIAVPTSVGYGANFGGLSALLAMLNSCAGGVTVVNIDNGFGAAYAASLIVRRMARDD